MPISTESRVVVLGGTSGVGLAIAKAAAAAGASVTVASRNPASVESALAQLPAGSARRAVEASSAEELAAFFQFLGDFDHFAYTAAGPLVPNPLAEYTAQAGQAFFELRLVAALDAIRLAVPRIRPGGSITMTSGTAAFRGSAGWVLGSAASGAIISAARALAVELAPIRVNVVAPRSSAARCGRRSPQPTAKLCTRASAPVCRWAASPRWRTSPRPTCS